LTGRLRLVKVSNVFVVAVAVVSNRTHTMPRHALPAYVAVKILHGKWGDGAVAALCDRGAASGGPSYGEPRQGDAPEPGPEPGLDGEAVLNHRRADREGRPAYRLGTWTANSRASFAPTGRKKPRCVPANDADRVCTSCIVLRRSSAGEVNSRLGPNEPLHSRPGISQRACQHWPSIC
jgi:hypothetical protein